VFGGIPMRATVIEDRAEQQRLWVLADSAFPAFVNYRRDASRHQRTIPLVELAAAPLALGGRTPGSDVLAAARFEGADSPRSQT
jgi:hypothetical protein